MGARSSPAGAAARAKIGDSALILTRRPGLTRLHAPNDRQLESPTKILVV